MWEHDNLKAEFDRDGFVVARGILQPSHLLALRQHAYRTSLVLLGRLGREDLITRICSEDIEHNLVELEHELPGFSLWLTVNRFLTHELLQVALCQPIINLVSSLLGPGRVALHPNLVMRCKIPGEQLHEVPWHQDSAYLRDLHGVDTIITVWVPCVPTSGHNGGLEVSPAGKWDRQELEHLPEVDNDGSWYLKLKESPAPSEVHALSTALGDLVIFRQDVPHRSVPNRATTTRLSFDIRYHLNGTSNGGIQPSLPIPNVGNAMTASGLLPDTVLNAIETSRLRSFSYPPCRIPTDPPWWDRWKTGTGDSEISSHDSSTAK